MASVSISAGNSKRTAFQKGTAYLFRAGGVRTGRLTEGALVRVCGFLFAFFFTVSSYAADIEPAFNALKQSAVNFEPDGAVCEQVARLKIQQDYPAADFIISGGIEYSTGQDTLGELDLVIVEKISNKVVMIAEVKCWKNLEQAMDKVKDQRNRFTWNLNKFPRQIRFTSYDGLQFKADQFKGISNFRSISQLGGLRRGFDIELELTLSELRELRMKLLKCQTWGDCARPE